MDELRRLQHAATDPQAIGYVSLDFVNGLSANPYNGTACNLRNAKSGEYGGVRNFWMVTRGRPASGNALQKFMHVKHLSIGLTVRTKQTVH